MRKKITNTNVWMYIYFFIKKKKNDEMACVKEVEAKIVDVILSYDDLVLKKDIKSSSHHNE